jgi:predicted transcriptional regulator
MKLKNGFVLREVCGEQVIMGEGLGAINFGRLLALNETAAWLWGQAQAMVDFTVDSLAERLCETYDVPAEQAHQDVTDIIVDWQELGIIEH